MKNVIVLVFCIICFCSCGKNNRNDCKNKETAILQCRAVNQPNYGYQYANEMCNREYSMERCY